MASRTASKAGKRLSVMAWIEDAFGGVIFVKQTKGGRWTLPGGKAKSGEALFSALRRELREEIGARISAAAPIDILDRPRSASVTILYRVLLEPGAVKARPPEIEKIAVRRRLPEGASATAAYFWQRSRKSATPLAQLTRMSGGKRRDG